MWHHVMLLTPGTSETQFAAAISSTSQESGLVSDFIDVEIIFSNDNLIMLEHDNKFPHVSKR